MRIENLRSESKNYRPSVTATVIWEDCNRPAMDVYFATDNAFAESLSCNPDAFLVGCILPAMHHSEARIWIDSEICPELQNGLETAMAWFRQWYYGPERNTVRIETRTRPTPSMPCRPPRAALFFSGGIDSLAALRANRLRVPLEHPGSFKDGLLIYGQNVESDQRQETFRQAVAELSATAMDAGLELIPVYTNLRDLENHGPFFTMFHGAILGAVAHAFARRLTEVTIAASDSIPAMALLKDQIIGPYGSHPLVDPNYGSAELRIRHAGITLSRVEKTRLIAGWESALQGIKVCGPNWPGKNCGQCPKCVLTMLDLLAVGALDKTRAFPADDISQERMAAFTLSKDRFDDDRGYYLELLEPLAERGRHDLVGAIEDMLKRSARRKTDWKGWVKQMDQHYLKGSLLRLKKRISHSALG